MKSVIIKPQSELLRQYVQYFLFFQKTDNNFLNYTTFPNVNLCLAIYKENNVNYNNEGGENSCIVKKGGAMFTSRFYGFHRIPFNAKIDSSLDQICIIFKPSALRAFTNENYDNVMLCDNIFDIFFSSDISVLEQVFNEKEFLKRGEMLEHLLLRNLKFDISYKIKQALLLISTYNDGTMTVEALAKMLDVSTPTLFRLFKNHLGQSPQIYLKTIRFRNVLNEILNKQHTLTSIAHLNHYYDQAHLINDFKQFSGYSPKQLFNRVSVQQNDLAWIYNKR